MRRIIGTSMCGILVLVGGCGASRESPAGKGPASPTASQQGSLSAQASAGPEAPRLETGPIPVGEHSVDFDPPFSFKVTADGWVVEFQGPYAIGLLHPPSAGMGEVGFGVGRGDRFTHAVDPITGVPGDVPADLSAWLQAHPFLQPMGAPERVTIAGIEGMQFDLAADIPSDKVVPGGAEAGIAPILVDPRGFVMNLEAGAAYRWIVLDTGNAQILITVRAAESAQLGRAIDVAQPILETLKFK